MSATGGIGGIGHKFSRRRVLVTLHIRFLHSQRSRGGLCESLRLGDADAEEGEQLMYLYGELLCFEGVLDARQYLLIIEY
jgi:hypothetical protein